MPHVSLYSFPFSMLYVYLTAGRPLTKTHTHPAKAQTKHTIAKLYLSRVHTSLQAETGLSLIG